MEGDFIKGKNRVVETITKPRRNLESSATTTATTEKIASHFKSHQVNTVAIQIGNISKKLPEMILMNRLKHVHPIKKGLFTGDLPITALSRKAVSFLEWKLLTKDQ